MEIYNFVYYYVQIVYDKKINLSKMYLYVIYIPVLLLCASNKNKSIVYRRSVITSS